MDIYNYDADGFFCSVSPADENPLEPGEYLIPSLATATPPPDTATGEAARYVEDTWIIVPDLVGTVYWRDGVEGVITDRGQVIPDGAVTEKPTSVLDDEFLAYKTHAKSLINDVRDQRIAAGLEFPANSGVRYDTDEQSQKNINGAVTMAILAAQSGEVFSQKWIAADNSIQTLNAAGMIALGIAVGKHVGRHKLAARAYKTNVDDAVTEADVDAIVAVYQAEAA